MASLVRNRYVTIVLGVIAVVHITTVDVVGRA